MNAPTVYQQLSYKIKIASMPYSGINAIHLSKTISSKGLRWHTADIHFQFKIENLRSEIFIFAFAELSS